MKTSDLCFPALALAVSLSTVACSSPAPTDEAASAESDLSSCAPLTTATGASLLAPGAGYGTVGTFTLYSSERNVDDITGAGPWSEWRSSDTGHVTFATADDRTYGPILSMTLQGSYDLQRGYNQTTWDVSPIGVIANGDVNYREELLAWYVRPAGIMATFETSNVAATNCSLVATSEPTRLGDREVRFEVRVTFSGS